MTKIKSNTDTNVELDAQGFTIIRQYTTTLHGQEVTVKVYNGDDKTPNLASKPYSMRELMEDKAERAND